jgi:hypothetical protein
MSMMTTENFCFYLQNRLIQISQTGGQQYSHTSPFSIPWLSFSELFYRRAAIDVAQGMKSAFNFVAPLLHSLSPKKKKM